MPLRDIRPLLLELAAGGLDGGLGTRRRSHALQDEGLGNVTLLDDLRLLRGARNELRRAQGRETPVGILPRPEDIDLGGLKLSNEALHQLLDLDTSAWHAEIEDIGNYLEGYGQRTPAALREKYQQVKKALG